MTAIEDFIRARLDEDEAEAQTTTDFHAPNGLRLATLYADDIVSVRALLMLTAVDGGRARAEIAAKRRLIKLASQATALDLALAASGPLGAKTDDGPLLGEEILRALALPYADHSDHDPAWRPA